MITEELRNLAVYLDSAAVGKSEHGFSPVALRLNRIADHIEQKHDEELARAQAEVLADCVSVADDFIELPKDADGKTIHLQDRMRWDNGTFDVHELNLTADGWTTWDELHGYTVRADQCRHVHEPTVEDVLREFGRGWHERMNGPKTFDIADYVERYAVKLRLAGEDA